MAEVLISERIVWQIERHFGRYGELREAEGQDKVFLTGYSSPRGLISWVFGLGAHASLQGPEELRSEFARRLKLLKDRHGRTLPGASAKATPVRVSAARGRGAWAADRLSAGRGGSSWAQRDRDPPGALRAAGDAREHPDRGRARRGR